MRYLIGLGNYTARDDAIGARVAEHVASTGMERGFRALDLGANSLNLIAYLVPQTEAILLVDAAEMGIPPGDWRFFTPDEVETKKPAGAGTHGGDVLRVLALARRNGDPIPPLVFLGVQPKDLGPGIGLSPELEARLPEYAAAAAARLLDL